MNEVCIGVAKVFATKNVRSKKEGGTMSSILSTSSSAEASERDSLLTSTAPGQRKPPTRSESSLRESVRSISEQLISKLSSSERKNALENLGIGPAAHLIRDAVIGERSYDDAWFDPYENTDQPLQNFMSVLCSRLMTYKAMVYLLHGTAWILVLLSFVEAPSWCQESNLDLVQGKEVDDFGTCGIILDARGTAVDGTANAEMYPNASSMMLTLRQARYFEIVCLCILFFFLFLQFGRAGFQWKRMFHSGSLHSIFSLQLALLCSLFAFVWLKSNAFSPFFRLMLLGTYLKNFQKEMRSLLGMLPQVGTILSVLGILIVFYGWFGVVIFYDSEQGSRDFSNLIEGCWTLWICVTTANYPDVMMPSYNDNRLSGIFFVSYMVISFFLLMNLILASVVNAYDEAIDGRKQERKDIAHECLTKAFRLMDPDGTGTVDRQTIMSLFFILNEDFPEIHQLSQDETNILFGFLDRDGSSMISMEEFQDFGSILLLEFTKQSDYEPFLQRRFPGFYHSSLFQTVSSAVRSRWFEFAIDTVLLLNAILIGLQSYPQLVGKEVELNPHYSNGYIDTWQEIVETGFTMFYVMEVVLKTTVVGWKRYRESTRNMFDFTITALALVATAYVYYPNMYNNSSLIRFVVMARVLRLGRLLMIFPAFQQLGSITAEILPAAMDIILLLFFLMYWFAALGMLLYGGMITRDPLNPLSSALLGNDFSDNDYWANNFNDLVSGMNVLFNLLVVNNWTNCEIGFEAVTGGLWVRLFFLSFHVCGVILVNNILLAYLINAYLQQLDVLQTRNDEDLVNGEAVIQGERALFDASSITGTKTGASGEYYARLRAIHADVEINEREGLRRLFTRTSSTVNEN